MDFVVSDRTRIRCGILSAQEYTVAFAFRRGHVDNSDVEIDAYHVVARESGKHEEP